jgi:hypothetical protein
MLLALGRNAWAGHLASKVVKGSFTTAVKKALLQPWPSPCVPETPA